jgi:hypothetical protein
VVGGGLLLFLLTRRSRDALDARAYPDVPSRPDGTAGDRRPEARPDGVADDRRHEARPAR